MLTPNDAALQSLYSMASELKETKDALDNANKEVVKWRDAHREQREHYEREMSSLRDAHQRERNDAREIADMHDKRRAAAFDDEREVLHLRLKILREKLAQALEGDVK